MGAIIILAPLLSVIHLNNNSFRGNEPLSLHYSLLSWAQLAVSTYGGTAVNRDHQPLFFGLLKLVRNLGFESEFALRLVPITAYLLGLLALYFFLQRLQIPRLASVIIVTLSALDPLILGTSHYIRPYSLYFALTFLSLLAFERFLEIKPRGLITLGAVNFVGTLCFGFFALIVLYEASYIAVQAKRQKLKRLPIFVSFLPTFIVIGAYLTKVANYRFIYRVGRDARQDIFNYERLIEPWLDSSVLGLYALLLVVSGGWSLLFSARPFPLRYLFLSCLSVGTLLFLKYGLGLDEIKDLYCVFLPALIYGGYVQMVSEICSLQSTYRTSLIAALLSLLVVITPLLTPSLLTLTNPKQHSNQHRRAATYLVAHRWDRKRVISNHPFKFNKYIIPVLDIVELEQSGSSPASQSTESSADGNKSESRILYAIFKEGEIDSNAVLEPVKSYPCDRWHFFSNPGYPGCLYLCLSNS